MPRKWYTSEQISVHFREVEVAKGQATAKVCRKLGITEQTDYLYGLLPVLQEES